MAKKLTQQEWIESCQKTHNNKYDYSKVEYINKRTKVCIICPKHGEFWQIANNHKRGQGCPICGQEFAVTCSKNNCGGLKSLSKQRFHDEYEFPYIKEEYENSHSLITIRHKTCGTIFKKIAGDHLTSKHGGCPCMRTYEKPKNTKEEKINYILQKSKEKFNDEYEYPNIEEEYQSFQSEITILHKKCGKTFKMKIKTHFDSDNGRCTCYHKRKKINSIDEFYQSFLKINEKLENQFSYNKNDYTNQNIPIEFYCSHCGNSFKRKPTVFIYMNHTCPHCNGKGRNRKYTTEEFINKANEIHNNKYDYSKSEYVTTDEKICVICHNKDEFGEEHGEFWVTPHSHLGLKTGCPKCSNKFGSQERFIKLSNVIHNNFYDYSKVNYTNALTDVEIICPYHGSFFTTPNEHLNGRGCQICNESSLERYIRKLLEDNNIEFESQKRFDWLQPLSLDFFLPQQNIAIECQGEQHFYPVTFFGGEESFKKRIENDNKKRQLCEENRIKLLYYSNLDIDYPYEVITETKDLLKKLLN